MDGHLNKCQLHSPPQCNRRHNDIPMIIQTTRATLAEPCTLNLLVSLHMSISMSNFRCTYSMIVFSFFLNPKVKYQEIRMKILGFHRRVQLLLRRCICFSMSAECKPTHVKDISYTSSELNYDCTNTPKYNKIMRLLHCPDELNV